MRNTASLCPSEQTRAQQNYIVPLVGLHTKQLCLYGICVAANKNCLYRLCCRQGFYLYLLLKVRMKTVNTPVVSLFVIPLAYCRMHHFNNHRQICSKMLISFYRGCKQGFDLTQAVNRHLTSKARGLSQNCVGFVVARGRAKRQTLLGNISVLPCMYHSASTTYLSVIF
jgi:hypothetical protein